MKSIFTLLLATIFTTSGFALDEAKLSVTIAASNEMQIVIDNRSYRLSENSIVLENIQPGQHTIQVYKQRGRSYDRNDRNNRNNRNDLLYSSTIYVRPNYHVDIMVNRFGKALVDERDLRYIDDRWNNGRNDRNDDYGRDNRYNQAMSDRDFNEFVQKIQSSWFGKMNTAKEGLGRNYFTAQQVRQVVKLFSSESDKLELAKLAYRNTVDQKNYYQVSDELFSQRSKDELDQYIRNNRW